MKSRPTHNIYMTTSCQETNELLIKEELRQPRTCRNALDTVEHPNQERYPEQQIHVIAIEEYVYLVPFVESNEEVFLKTIIPSRKATKSYLGEGK